MFIPIVIIIMIFSTISFFTYPQENPPAEMSAEEFVKGKEIEQSPEQKEPNKQETAEQKTTTQETSEQLPETTSLPEASQEPIPEEPVQSTTLETIPETTPAELTSPTTPVISYGPITPAIAPTEILAPTETATIESPSVSIPTESITPEVASTTMPSALPIAPVAPELEEPESIIPEEPIAPEEPTGIDTVSLENPQGNWLFKRIWWERAEERYEKIRLLVDSIWESRNKFFYERNQLDRNVLDPFYITIGIDQGELQIMLSEINDFIEKQREPDVDLNEQERMLITEEERLKQLKIDVDMITNLDHAIDDALGTFMNQINRVRNYEADAWKNFKEIAHILNDTRARELYYMIEGAARNIKTISNYLEQEFFTHFNKLIQDAKTRVARVQNQMEALKEKGVMFQRKIEQTEEQNSIKEETQEEEEETKPKPKVGWFSWISSGISKIFSYIWVIIRLPYDLFFGKK